MDAKAISTRHPCPMFWALAGAGWRKSTPIGAMFSPPLTLRWMKKCGCTARPEQRLQYLTQMRIRAPEQGRDRLAQEMSSLDARERATAAGCAGSGSPNTTKPFWNRHYPIAAKRCGKLRLRLLCCLPESASDLARMKSRISAVAQFIPAPETLLKG